MAASNRNYSNLGADAKVRFMDLALLPQERKELLSAIESAFARRFDKWQRGRRI